MDELDRASALLAEADELIAQAEQAANRAYLAVQWEPFHTRVNTANKSAISIAERKTESAFHRHEMIAVARRALAAARVTLDAANDAQRQ